MTHANHVRTNSLPRSTARRATALAVLLAALATTELTMAREPAAGPASVFASGLSGPEGLAFTRDGRLLVGSTTGDILSFRPNGASTLFATVPAPLAGITVLSDGRVLAASVPLGQVWAVSPNGDVSLFAEGIGGPNFIVQSIRDGRIYASASNTGEIVEITDGVPQVRATGLDFPNGLAIREERGVASLYVALTLPGQVVRLPIRGDGSLGDPELYAEGLTLIDGIAFDDLGNLLAVGFNVLSVVTPDGEVSTLSEGDPVFDWPANLAFGQGPGFNARDAYLADFGQAFGDGIDVIRLRYSNKGAPLASSAGDPSCVRRRLGRTGLHGTGLIRCFPARLGRR